MSESMPRVPDLNFAGPSGMDTKFGITPKG